MAVSRTQIDKAGKVLSAPKDDFDEEYLNQYIVLEDAFDKFRESHLSPLTMLTGRIQEVLAQGNYRYYIAQRLKRKPQIIRKLKRLSVRLTQLQDIGGLRVIVDDNTVVDAVSLAIDRVVSENPQYNLHRTTDYRPLGRDDSGYRALHKILSIDGKFLELQIRSQAQHHWAESVERTSVFYGRRIKEGEGSEVVISYFKSLSMAYAELERGSRLSREFLSDLRILRENGEALIRRDGFSQLMDGVVNEDVIKTLVQIEKSNPGQMNNWILVFNWNTANFVTWAIAGRSTEEAVAQYVKYENEFPEDQKFEVVLIGSSDVLTVQKTHSHYFGITRPDKILDDLGDSIPVISSDIELDTGAKTILSKMFRRKIWGNGKGIQRQTLQNHFCKDVNEFGRCLDLLIEKRFVTDKGGAGVTLNISMTSEIEKFV